MDIKAELRDSRRKVLKAIDSAKTPMDFYDIQKHILLDIINSEKEYFNNGQEAYREHVLSLRSYGDTIPWIILSQKGISKVYNGNIKLHFLSRESERINRILEEGKKYALRGHLVVLGASTNICFGSDIVICDNEKEPLSINISDLSFEDEKLIKFEGFKISKRVKSNWVKNINKSVSSIYSDKKVDMISWRKINASIGRAVLENQGYCLLEEGNFVWAFRYNGDMPDMNEEISSIVKKYTKVMVGCHFTILDEPALMIPPPSCWPIEIENRMALMEGDIALMHYIDMEALKNIQKPEGYIKDIVYNGSRLAENCIVVSSRHKEKIYSSKYVNDILYGYWKIGDMANKLIDNVSI